MDLNRASEAEIAAAVGTNKASKIVVERDANGSFADLGSVGTRTHGVAKSTLKKLREAGFVVGDAGAEDNRSALSGASANGAAAAGAAASDKSSVKDLTKDFQKIALGSGKKSKSKEKESGASEPAYYAKAAPRHVAIAAAEKGEVVTAAVVGAVATGWPHDRRVAVPAEFRGVKLMEFPEEVEAQNGGRARVSWGGQTFTQSEWRKTLLAWEKRYPKFKKHPHETLSERSRATTEEATIDFCFSKLRRIRVRGTGWVLGLEGCGASWGSATGIVSRDDIATINSQLTIHPSHPIPFHSTPSIPASPSPSRAKLTRTLRFGSIHLETWSVATPRIVQ